MAGNVASTMKEKMRAGVNAAANKVEEALTTEKDDAKTASRRQRGASFDLRAENLRVEETAAEALERAAAAAETQSKGRNVSDKTKDKRNEALAGALKDKAEHDATVDLEEKHKKDAYKYTQRPQQRKPVRRPEMRAYRITVTLNMQPSLLNGALVSVIRFDCMDVSGLQINQISY